MILNVSGRTDIVAFYTPWFIKRYHEGYVDVRNPFNKNLVSRLYFEDVSLILFCTKNPQPIIDFLPQIKQPIIFHITITPYKENIEPNVPDKTKIIESVKKISTLLGADNVYVRYDPIFISPQYNIAYHLKAFTKLCSLLEGYVKHIIVSFLDEYKNVINNKDVLQYQNITEEDYREIGLNFAKIAKTHGMTVQTCFEKRNLAEYGFTIQDCLSKELASKMTGQTHFKKWQARHKHTKEEGSCNCVAMVDIGAYNSCQHFCKYCYANFDERLVKSNISQHNPSSSLLIGELSKEDIIKRRLK